MKIQCNGCDLAEAKGLCCADEAVLCWDCDQRVHAANKLSSKHQGVPLTHFSSQMPKCDIRHETLGYFFCLEDRALVCRKCDVAIHTANAYVSGHQRFQLTGLKVGLESAEPSVSSTIDKLDSIGKASETTSAQSISKRGARIPIASEDAGMLHGLIMAIKVPFPAGTTVGNIATWHLDEYLGMTDFSQNYAVTDNVSSSKVCGRYRLQFYISGSATAYDLGGLQVSWKVLQKLGQGKADRCTWM